MSTVRTFYFLLVSGKEYTVSCSMCNPQDYDQYDPNKIKFTDSVSVRAFHSSGEKWQNYVCKMFTKKFGGWQRVPTTAYLPPEKEDLYIEFWKELKASQLAN